MNRWILLGAVFVAMMLIGLYQYSWTMFTIPIKEARGWSMPAIQLTFTICIWIMTWTQPVAGVIADRRGPRILALVAALVAGAGWIGSSYASRIEVLYIFYGMGGIGVGTVYALSIGVGNKWFPDRRGLATGFSAAGYGFGAAIFNPIIHQVIKKFGYEAAFWGIGLLMLAILTGVSLLLRYPSPEWVLPRKVVPKIASSPPKDPTGIKLNFTMKEMVRTPQWWLIYLAFCNVANIGLLVAAQLRPMGKAFAIPDAIVVLAATTFPITNGLGRPLGGWISDRIGRSKTMTLYFTLLGLCSILLLFGGTYSGTFVLLVTLVGLLWGPIFAFFPSIIGDYFGTKYDTPQKLDKAIKWMLACRNSKEERLDEEKQEDT